MNLKKKSNQELKLLLASGLKGEEYKKLIREYSRRLTE